MMADINITTSIAQLPHLQAMAGAQLAHPEVQQVFAQQMAQEALKQRMQQVQKVERQEQGEGIKADQDGRRGSEGGHTPGRRGRHAREEAREEEPMSASASPWVGHLVNRKV